MRIFLIRHAEPEQAWGVSDDPGLSARGQAQAQAVGEALSGKGALRILSSPMLRCRETAAPFIAACGRPAAIEPRFSEVATPTDIADRRAWLMQNFAWRDGAAPTHWRGLDPKLWAWRSDVLAALAAQQEKCAIFSHFIAINTIVGAALERSETIVFRPDFASVTEMEIEGGALRVVKLGAEMVSGEVR